MQLGAPKVRGGDSSAHTQHTEADGRQGLVSGKGVFRFIER
jgi:hypothetical protein